MINNYSEMIFKTGLKIETHHWEQGDVMSWKRLIL